MKTLLFFTRLTLYLLLALVPYMLSAAIAVQYDKVAKLTWFFLVPAEMLIAYFLSYSRTRKIWASPAAALGLLAFMILFFSEFSWHTMLLFAGGGLLAWLWTVLVFSKGGGRFRSLAVLELFAFAFIYFKLLNFTRASEEIALATGRMIHFVLFLAALSFLIHGIVLYYAAFARARASSGKRRRELFVFASFAIPLFLLISMALPANFLKHNPLETELDDEPPPKGEQLNPDADARGKGRGARPPQEGNGLPLGDGEKKYPAERQSGGGSSDQGKGESERGQRPDEHRGGGGSGAEEGGKGARGREEGKKGGSGQQQSEKQKQNQGGQGQKQSEKQKQGGQGQSQKEQERNQSQKQPQQKQKKDKQRLEGIPSDQWSQRQQMSGAANKQFAVMVIASPVDPIYAARTYLGLFDPERGFLRTPDGLEPLNTLARRRLLETWQDQIADADDKRRPVSTFFLSTEPERVLAYRPFEIQPSIRDTIYEPFSYSWNAVSRMSLSKPSDWELVPELTERQRDELDFWLTADMPQALRRRFAKYNRSLGITKEDRPFARLEKILKGFKRHQYKMGFKEDTRPAHLAEFLLKTKEGDCTEFANSAALLARLNGLPSRVVHGYLGSKDLQTRYHKGGLKHLREKIKPLQKFKLDELYLITTSHRHAWFQVYLSGYGWIDFESTAYAIRPKPKFNPNNMDVVIPLIKEKDNRPKEGFVFPWRLALKVLAGLLLLVTLALYTLQAVRQLYFHLRKGTKSKAGLQAYLMLLLMQMARDGYAIKAPHLTPLEYATNHEALRDFAKLYAKLRFKVNYLPGEREESERAFRENWKELRRKVKRPGFKALLKRRLSLRGLYY